MRVSNEAIVETYISMHELAKKMGYSSILEALEELDNLKNNNKQSDILNDAKGTITGLVSLLLEQGAADDLVSQFLTDAKTRNGQFLDQFAKKVRKAVNESRAFLSQIEAALNTIDGGKTD